MQVRIGAGAAVIVGVSVWSVGEDKTEEVQKMDASEVGLAC